MTDQGVTKRARLVTPWTDHRTPLIPPIPAGELQVVKIKANREKRQEEFDRIPFRGHRTC